MLGSVDSVMRFERSPGSEQSLLVLYGSVQAAEELDLAEQAREDALWADAEDEPAQDDVNTSDDEDDADEARVTMSQAIGIVEHLLGGHSVP